MGSILKALRKEGKKLRYRYQWDEKLSEERMEICNSCEFFFTPTGNCKKCGCFMKIKTKMKGLTCPIGKW
tara:strand:+ start:2369 stop:2578 length:210 start_codon:yes stop_codon:yes gene_type:complete